MTNRQKREAKRAKKVVDVLLKYYPTGAASFGWWTPKQILVGLPSDPFSVFFGEGFTEDQVRGYCEKLTRGGVLRKLGAKYQLHPKYRPVGD